MFESDEALLILGSLSQRSMNTWDLSAHMQLGGKIQWTNLDRDDVCRLLDYMRRNRLVDRVYHTEEKGKVYSITDAGRDVLARWVRQTVIANRPVTLPFDLLVNAMGALSLDERYQLIEKRRSAVVARLEQYDEIAGNLSKNQVTHSAILQHHQIILQAELKWLDEMDTNVEAWDFETGILSEESGAPN